MKEGDGGPGKSRRASHADGPAIQVICLGSGGGPSEDNVTGFLVRSVASNWAKGSVLAVDAGSHLAAITRILENNFPAVANAQPAPQTPENEASKGAPANRSGSESLTPEPQESPVTTLDFGPFAGLPFPHASARANASYVVREHVSTYLITHPHLDHVSGFVINTAAFHNTSRPKRLAALPFTVNSIKTHIFNDIIWPNLTDEDGGVGFVTFQRLAEGGNIALGDGPSRGFIEVCDGLGAKGFKVSHGHCMRGTSHVHRGSMANLQETTSTQHQHTHSQGGISRTGTGLSNADSTFKEGRSMSFSIPSQPGTPQFAAPEPSACVVDSTAYFIRAEATPTTPAREVLIFGDVEPDSISLSPRTAYVWAEAAPKIAQGMLTGIFIECSYADSQADQVLFGHLAPRHLIAELQSLASMVREAKRDLDREREEKSKGRKRTRQSAGFLSVDHSTDDGKANKSRRESRTTQGSANEDVDDHMLDMVSPRSTVPKMVGRQKENAPLGCVSEDQRSSSEPPLKGVKVVVIHVKDTLADGPPVGDTILNQLNEHEESLSEQGQALGCEFVVSASGGSYYF